MEQEESEHTDPDSDPKSWDFPKIHFQSHLFEDIIAKGVTRNYNTKISESLHGPIRQDYLSGTNFRDVDKQVSILKCKKRLILTLNQLLNRDHLKYTTTFYRKKIDYMDETSISSGGDETTGLLPPTLGSGNHIYLGSQKVVKTEDGKLKDVTVAEFAEELGTLKPPGGFRRILEDFINKQHRHHGDTYFYVRGDQKVISKASLLRMCYSWVFGRS